MYEHPQYATFVFLVCSMMSRAALPILWYNYMNEYIKKAQIQFMIHLRHSFRLL